MKNYLKPGTSMTVVAAGTVASGDLVNVNGQVGVAGGAATVGQNVEVELEGVFTVPLVAGPIAQGTKLFLSGTSVTSTDTTAGLPFVGRAHEAVGTAALTVPVKLAECSSV